MTGMNANQHSHMRVEYLRFRACSDKHRDHYHSECPDCIQIGKDVVCSDPNHYGSDDHSHCPTCYLIESKLASDNTEKEERKLIDKILRKKKL